MKPTIGIFEPLYKAGQTQTEPAFLPLMRETNARPEWREFQILVDIYRSGKYLEHDYTGVFSPKFNLKCKITSEQFLEFVWSHPGKDVYFINPFPQLAYWSFNVWMQGEHAHPGLCKAAQKLLDACDIKLTINDTPRHDPDVLAYSNFWIGSREFWQKYVGGILIPIAEFLENNASHPAALGVMTETTHTDPAPFLPFIVERLFSTYLSSYPELKICAYPNRGDEVLKYCLGDFEKTLYKHMVPSVLAADEARQFSAEFISQMNMLCALWQQHHFDLYALKPHPHTGKPLGNRFVAQLRDAA